MKRCAYPSHTQAQSKAIVYKNYGRILDRICAVILIVGCVGSMAGLVCYANYRDTQYFNSNRIASFPSRPEECNGECEPMHEEYIEYVG